MNNQRRKAIEKLKKSLEEEQEAVSNIVARVEDIKNELEALKDEEQEAFDNMPESLQQGDKGQAAETAIGALDSALEHLLMVDDWSSNIDDALAFMDEAVNA